MLPATSPLWRVPRSARMVPSMNTAIISSDWAGRVIAGKYTLLQWSGGSAASGVFLTELQGSSSQQAVIKLVAAEAANTEARLAAWTAAATLSHPHLMRVFDSGSCEIDDAAFCYMVTEYADENLSQILPDRPLTAAETGEMLDPVLDALSYLHGKGLVHGCLKPSNLMVVNDQLKLSADSLEAVGKPSAYDRPPGIYDAPERGAAILSPAADVWSLGITLVEALTQNPPVWDLAANREPVVPDSMPQPFAEIARECLRRDPARRCTLGDINARLHPVPPVQPQTGKTVQTKSAKPRAMMLIGAAIVLLAVLASLHQWTHKTRPPLPAEDQRPAAGTQTAQGAHVKATVLDRVLPDVPQSASATIWGTVVVKIRVTADSGGKVTNAVFESPGPSRYFAKLALQAAWKWRFKPAQVDGRAAASVWMLQFQFRSDSTTVVPVEVSP